MPCAVPCWADGDADEAAAAAAGEGGKKEKKKKSKKDLDGLFAALGGDEGAAAAAANGAEVGSIYVRPGCAVGEQGLRSVGQLQRSWCLWHLGCFSPPEASKQQQQQQQCWACQRGCWGCAAPSSTHTATPPSSP